MLLDNSAHAFLLTFLGDGLGSRVGTNSLVDKKLAVTGVSVADAVSETSRWTERGKGGGNILRGRLLDLLIFLLASCLLGASLEVLNDVGDGYLLLLELSELGGDSFDSIRTLLLVRGKSNLNPSVGSSVVNPVARSLNKVDWRVGEDILSHTLGLVDGVRVVFPSDDCQVDDGHSLARIGLPNTVSWVSLLLFHFDWNGFAAG